MMQKGVLIFSASILERIGSNGIILRSFFKKQGRKKGKFKVIFGTFVATTILDIVQNHHDKNRHCKISSISKSSL